MENLEKVYTSKHYNFPRNTILVPLANALNIDHTQFKNRRDLIKEIKQQVPASKICENSQDFITLCDIDEIPKNRLFIWSQNNKTSGADILSLKKDIDLGKTMNPWTIDFATGIDDANDREGYLKVFDMKNQRGLLKRIKDFYEQNITSIEVEDNEESNTQHECRFSIEKYGDEVDQYVSHIINCIESCDFRIFIHVLSDTLKVCLEYFIANNDLVAFSVLEPIFLKNELLKFHIFMRELEGVPDNIRILNDVLNIIKSHKCEIYYIGVIKYFFIEIEESLKNYNLLNL